MDLGEFDLGEPPLEDAGPTPFRRRNDKESSLALQHWNNKYMGQVKLLLVVCRSHSFVTLDDLDTEQLNGRVQDWLCDHTFVENFPSVMESCRYCCGMLLVRCKSSMPGVNESPYALPFEKRIQSR